MTEFITLHGKKYPKSLITYVMTKPSNENKSVDQLPEKYLDEMRQVIKDGFEKNGINKGVLYTFYPDMIPVWQDLADAKGYKLINIKENKNSGTYQADVVKSEYRKQKRKVKTNRYKK
jgi:hypothetical protein